MDKSEIRTEEDIARVDNYIKVLEKQKKEFSKLQKKSKKMYLRLQEGFTNEQKEGAKITARKKQEQKEWFYQNIWKPYREKGIKDIKSILIQAKNNHEISVEDNKYHFSTSDNNKFSKSLSTLQNWHTEFKKRSNDSQ